MTPQMTCASALPGKIGKPEIHAFHLDAVYMHCQSSTNLFDSRLILTLLYDSLNLVS